MPAASAVHGLAIDIMTYSTRFSTKAQSRLIRGGKDHGRDDISRTAGHIGRSAERMAEGLLSMRDELSTLPPEKVGDMTSGQLEEAAELLQRVGELLPQPAPLP